MSIEEALLLAALAKGNDPNVKALKVIGYQYSLAAKKIIRLEKTIEQLERKLRYGK